MSNDALIARYLVEGQIKDRFIDYWDEVDRNKAENAASFYTQDCTYQMLDLRMEGQDAIKEYYAYRINRGERVVRHFVTNLRVIIHSPDAASLRGMLCAYAGDGVPILPAMLPVNVADVDCEFVRSSSDIWLMKFHKLTGLFANTGKMLRPPNM